MIGHFTQVIWKESTHLGLGVTTKVSDWGLGEIVVVARYTPRGNIHVVGNRYNDYSRNVQPLGPCLEPTKEETADKGSGVFVFFVLFIVVGQYWLAFARRNCPE